MKKLPKIVREAWENRDGFTILTTVDKAGVPNSVYIGAVELYKESKIVIADNYFDKTKANIFNASKGSFLFISKERKAYQLKGTFTYRTEGNIFNFMKSWNPDKHPGHAAAILEIEEIYNGAEKVM